jgi:hypothetical protein
MPVLRTYGAVTSLTHPSSWSRTFWNTGTTAQSTDGKWCEWILMYRFYNNVSWKLPKAKANFTLQQATKAQRGEYRYASTLSLTSVLVGVGGQRHAPAALSPGKIRCPYEAGWAPGLVWTATENLAHTGIRSPDPPARSKSLYRLSYPGSLKKSSLACNKSLCTSNKDVRRGTIMYTLGDRSAYFLTLHVWNTQYALYTRIQERLSG